VNAWSTVFFVQIDIILPIMNKIHQRYGFFSRGLITTVLSSTSVEDKWILQPMAWAIYKEQPLYFPLKLFGKYQLGYTGQILGCLCLSASELVETRPSSLKKLTNLIQLIFSQGFV
jgi:hypothetical protein